jgi:hypothetical protein
MTLVGTRVHVSDPKKTRKSEQLADRRLKVAHFGALV